MKHLRQYEIVIEIARRGSVSRAADALGISQPTLSKLLQKTEEQLGIELFDRQSLPMKLTDFGQRYVAAGQRILDEDRRLKKELEQIKNSENLPLRVGISPSRAPYLLPTLLREYRKLEPKGRLVIKEGNTAQLNAELQRGELDLIISLLGDNTRSFEYKSLFFENTIMAVPRSMEHMEALDILRTQPVISIGSGLRMWRSLIVILEAVGGKTPDIECQSIEAALALVDGGLGAMLIPSYIAEYGAARRTNVAFKELPEEYRQRFKGELERQVCVFYRSDAFLTLAEQRFIQACEMLFHKDFLEK